MEHKYTALVVEDDKSIAGFISACLVANGYSVLGASDGTEAKMMISSYCPDVIILDLGLPDMDGLEIISSVREWSNIPIVVVSARSDEGDKVEALDRGADDYVTKPFGTEELLARVRTAIRHTSATSPDIIGIDGVFRLGDLTVDFTRRYVYVKDKRIHLTHNEYKIVALLANYPGRVLTYESIMKHVWGPNFKSDNQILRVNMANIRRKLEENPAQPIYIITELGVGYRMAEPEKNK